MEVEYKHVRNSEYGGDSGESSDREDFYKPALYAILCGLGAFMFGYTLGFTSPALPAMYGQNDKNIFDPKQCQDSSVSSPLGSLFSSIVNIGAVGGAMFTGSLADAVGRRMALAASAGPLVSGWVWLALTTDPAQAIVSRALAGVGVGMSSVIVPLYIAEISPDAYRGALVSMNQLLITVGIFGVYLIGELLPHESTTYAGCDDADTKTIGPNWTILAWIGAMLSGCLLIVAAIIPESPAYHFSNGDRDKAAAVMRKLWGSGYNPERYFQDQQKDGEGQQEKAGFRDILAPESRTPMIIGCMLMVFQQWSGNNAVIFFCSSIFKTAGLEDTDQASLYVMSVQVIATGVSVYLMDRAGRRTLLLTATIGMTVASASLGVLFLLQHMNASPGGWVTIIVLIAYIIFFSIGMGPIPWLVMNEIFPDHTRALAGSIATVINWFSAFAVTYLFADMQQSLMDYGTFWFYAVVCLMAVLFTATMLPETKGLSNLQIQAALARVAPCGGGARDQSLSIPNGDEGLIQ